MDELKTEAFLSAHASILATLVSHLPDIGVLATLVRAADVGDGAPKTERQVRRARQFREEVERISAAADSLKGGRENR